MNPRHSITPKPQAERRLGAAADEDDAMALVIVQERQSLHHPRVESAAGVFCDLARDVNPILEPLQLGAGRRRKDGDLTVFALVAVLHRGSFAAEKRPPLLRAGVSTVVLDPGSRS